MIERVVAVSVMALTRGEPAKIPETVVARRAR
jgi:hypothetical protein